MCATAGQLEVVETLPLLSLPEGLDAELDATSLDQLAASAPSALRLLVAKLSAKVSVYAWREVRM